MTDITKAQATQLTGPNVENKDWKVTIGEEELYTLPASYSVQDTFTIRDVVEKMMKKAYNEGLQEMAAKKDKEIENIKTVGQNQIDFLASENEKIANAFDNLSKRK